MQKLECIQHVKTIMEELIIISIMVLLPTVLICLKKKNPGMTVILESSEDGTNSFHRMFIALPNFSTYVGVATLKIISADAAASRSRYYDGITVVFVTKSGKSKPTYYDNFVITHTILITLYDLMCSTR